MRQVSTARIAIYATLRAESAPHEEVFRRCLDEAFEGLSDPRRKTRGILAHRFVDVDAERAIVDVDLLPRRQSVPEAEILVLECLHPTLTRMTDFSRRDDGLHSFSIQFRDPDEELVPGGGFIPEMEMPEEPRIIF